LRKILRNLLYHQIIRGYDLLFNIAYFGGYGSYAGTTLSAEAAFLIRNSLFYLFTVLSKNTQDGFETACRNKFLFLSYLVV
jgi:hypothetical protein